MYLIISDSSVVEITIIDDPSTTLGREIRATSQRHTIPHRRDRQRRLREGEANVALCSLFDRNCIFLRKVLRHSKSKRKSGTGKSLANFVFEKV